MTVDRQMKRYQVPRLAFINKMDRTGANPVSVIQQVREKLGAKAVAYQIPIGLEDNFEGVVDLVTMKAYYFDGDNGENVRIEDVPEDLQADAKAARDTMLDELSMYSDELMEKLLGEEEVSEELIHEITRSAVIEQAVHSRLHGFGFQEQSRPTATRSNHPLPTVTARTRKRRKRSERRWQEDGH